MIWVWRNSSSTAIDANFSSALSLLRSFKHQQMKQTKSRNDTAVHLTNITFKLFLSLRLLLAAHLRLHLLCSASGSSHDIDVVMTAGFDSSAYYNAVICVVHSVHCVEAVSVEKVKSPLKWSLHPNGPVLIWCDLVVWWWKYSSRLYKSDRYNTFFAHAHTHTHTHPDLFFHWLLQTPTFTWLRLFKQCSNAAWVGN